MGVSTTSSSAPVTCKLRRLARRMPYLIDRERALRTTELIAVIGVRQRQVRSHVVLADNSLHRTPTRPRTFVRLGGTAFRHAKHPRR